MTSDPPPTCRPCGQRGIVTLATWVRNDHEVQNWTLCDRHAALIKNYGFVGGTMLSRLPDPAEAVSGDQEAGA